MNGNGPGFFVLKIFSYVLGIFQAALYTPVVLSIALFVIIASMFFHNGDVGPLFRLFPDGSYATTDLLAMYGKYAFGLSLLLVFVETVFKKRFAIGAKKKAILLGSLLSAGYGLTLVFFITRTELTAGDALVALIPFFFLSLMAIILDALLSALTQFINERIDSPPRSPTNGLR